jgi:hypothetical protein
MLGKHILQCEGSLPLATPVHPTPFKLGYPPTEPPFRDRRCLDPFRHDALLKRLFSLCQRHLTNEFVGA